MRADLPRLFQEVDVFFGEQRFRVLGVMFVDELRQAKSAGHAGRASAHYDDICFHHRPLDAGKRFPKDDHETYRGKMGLAIVTLLTVKLSHVNVNPTLIPSFQARALMLRKKKDASSRARCSSYELPTSVSAMRLSPSS